MQKQSNHIQHTIKHMQQQCSTNLLAKVELRARADGGITAQSDVRLDR